MERELNRFGIRCYAYFVKSKRDNGAPLVVSNYPNEWVNQYSRDNLYRHDPVINFGMQRVAPYAWSEALNGTNNSVFNLSREFNIESGFSFPLHDPKSRFAALSICNRDQDPEFANNVSRSMNTLMMLFLKSHEALAKLIPSPNPVQEEISCTNDSKVIFKLTEREIDVLSWASQGKTYSEVSIILGITVRTVKFHIENIINKLDVSNAKHAIYKAKHYGII
ncbi:helix-turn-helix transcriptional regulator [Halomonas llamarensis]|uniref:LuxR family transcriptional regulator n=1 Tax=Halomonas llamarensis TaxID=2945104 RepID=A0ABT0SQ58_9GAMM|nr:LuxR family transcriptional regulator [Halomonas llamarensis]MCL7929912.1 LuxR family transcriptional regulator [Halomonas llamarensis]